MGPQDSDYTEYVRNYLGRPYFRIGGTDIKILSTMGDRFARVVLEALDEPNLNEGSFLQKVLAAVRVSHQYIDNIQDDSDRVPVKSVELLNALLDRVDSDDQKARIQATLQIIIGQE